ncbi:acyltransferase [Trinickia caryophylli]|uniref:Peptidoglycan/LPS O-acetylase OafA/YrhL, contains acyltransferase and SGNH-hydrolase domains n=1 Tax=Trinickia caryophylli TaxID=28094 RepID=A0A1X7G224_TRICW|nr:acyltransferase [Trinickia caryophylli]PMS13685.1 acyltransferase [Trinickia caryophylli]TRX14178.1 acyltransferase [Trinickia caryophylli]WQE14002.1 acyltransferase [Trinickia caryophylli]SMF62555.1 Peptidoglycan/LPS O-acetylase OafA/YrhL, contains acyltransferase and SGNH-hydrolase domains [Trinickia caryophylli]
MNKNGVTAAISRRTLGLFFAFSLIFVIPKSFLVDYTTGMASNSERWAYIVIADAIPASLVAVWVWCYAGRVSVRHALASAGPDPLLSLRFIACMVVMFGHYFGVVFAPPSGPAVHPHFIERLLMSAPWAGVWMFFVLSGYLMGKGFFSGRYALDEFGVADFLWNRALRIWPVYAFALFVVMVFVYPQTFQRANLWMPAQVLLMDYSGHMPINIIGALWSVSTEFQFYLLAPLIALAINWVDRKWGARYWMLALVIAIGSVVNIWLARRMDWDLLRMLKYIYNPIGANLFLFVAGMFFAKLRMNTGKRAPGMLSAGSMVLGLMLLAQTLLASYMAFYGTRFARYLVYVPPLVVAGTLLTIGLWESCKVEGRMAWFVRWTQLGGTLTYCIYVLHSDVMLALRKIAPPVIGLTQQAAYAPLVFGLTFLFSYAMYRGVEKPVAGLKR